jgi:hypothetical protein
VVAPAFSSPIGDTAHDAKLKTATQTAVIRPVCRQTATDKAAKFVCFGIKVENMRYSPSASSGWGVSKYHTDPTRQRCNPGESVSERRRERQSLATAGVPCAAIVVGAQQHVL